MTFVTCIYNDNHLSMLGVLIESIYSLYGNEAKVHIYYKYVSSDWMNKLNKVYPFLKIESHDMPHNFEDDFRKMLFWHKTIETFFEKLASRKLNFWCEAVESISDNKIALIDVDMLMLKKIDSFFDSTFDIGFTYTEDKDEGFDWLLNVGIIIVNNRKKCIPFFRYWKDESNTIISNPKANLKAEMEWGAADQAVLGRYLNFSNDCDKIINKNDLIFKGFECKVLNEIRCVPINDNLHIIHYKGSWHRVLRENRYNKLRPESKCHKMKEIWETYYNIFKNKMENT